MAKPTATAAQPGFRLPLPYTVFFLFLEPVLAVMGAYKAHADQVEYLRLTHAASAPATSADLPTATGTVLSQLANMYLFFGLVEACVLRSTGDMTVWRAVLGCMLVGDAGHLWSLRGLATAANRPDLYYNVASWNAMDWGNVPMVYVGAALRACFLAGLGLEKGVVDGEKQQQPVGAGPNTPVRTPLPRKVKK